MARTGRLSYYTAAGWAHPQLFDGEGKYLTKAVFTALKRKKSPRLRHFSIHFTETGQDYIKVEIPPAFEGHILNQIYEEINGD